MGFALLRTSLSLRLSLDYFYAPLFALVLPAVMGGCSFDVVSDDDIDLGIESNGAGECGNEPDFGSSHSEGIGNIGMRPHKGACTTAAGLSGTSEAGDDAEHFVQFFIRSRRELDLITRIVSIDRVDDLRVRAYTGNAGLMALARYGYDYDELPHPGLNPDARMGARKRSGRIEPDAYPTYADYVALMQRWAREFPTLCKLVDLGPTSNASRPHRLMALKISDNPEREEDEPEVFLSSTMHGDETVGFVVLLRFVEDLLTSYGGDAETSRLVDGLEIWVNPLANPDGTYFRGDGTVNGAIRGYTRANGSYGGVDPNRNFPLPGQVLSEEGRFAETRAMMRFAAAHTFVLGANLHGGAEVVNYPWDVRAEAHADDAWFKAVSRAYADLAQEDGPAAYMTELDNGITNGYEWYPAPGSRQDFVTYFYGAREVTVEVSETKNPNSAQLPSYFSGNRRALRTFVGAALQGARGIVRGPEGEPLAAQVEVLNHDVESDHSYVTTDPDVGDYHRLLLPGTYSLRFTASGMSPVTVRNVVVDSGDATRVDVTLERAVSVVALVPSSDEASEMPPGSINRD